MSARRHASAVLLLPGLVGGVVPALLVWAEGPNAGWGLPLGLALLTVLAGLALLAAGLILLARTIWLLAAVGQGTLAPWDPTSRLVVLGPYRYVRNPMITGVLAVLLGEAALLGSPAVLGWFAAVLAVNAVYLPLVEERGLRRRFGPAYDEYRAHVPRWLPRLRPWEPTAGD